MRSSLVGDTTTQFTRRQERFQFSAVTSGLASLQIDHKVQAGSSFTTSLSQILTVMTLGVLMAGQIDVLDVETHVLRRVAEEVVLTDVVRLDGVEGGEDGKAGVAGGSEAWK